MEIAFIHEANTDKQKEELFASSKRRGQNSAGDRIKNGVRYECPVK